ncbi:MAG TPA: hypothetical protein VMT00_10985 [Thermoanaerobaculia bacterium]|nr:hypothetical protein [Thermoanaerobaculia bacterium]
MPNQALEESGTPSSRQHDEWIAEFEAAARRPLQQRMRYAFIRTYKPVLDDEPFRAFETMAEYRVWCEENLPSWLGYGRS